MRVFLIFFILLFSTNIFTNQESEAEITSEIASILKNKFKVDVADNEFVKFDIAEDDKRSKTEVLTDLRSVLEGIEHPHNLAVVVFEVTSFDFTQGMYLRERGAEKKKWLTATLSTESPPEEWVRFLSSKPEEEPMLKEYMVAQEEVIEGAQGEWNNTVKQIENAVCGGEVSSAEELKEKLLADPTLQVESAEIKTEDLGKTLRIKSNLSGSSVIEIMLDEGRIEKNLSIVNLRISNINGSWPQLLPFGLDELVIGGTRHINKNYDHNGCGNVEKLESNLYVDNKLNEMVVIGKYGIELKRQSILEEFKPLSSIYSDCDKENPLGLSTEELEEFANDNSKIVIAVLDSGVKYNSKQLAYRVANRKLTPEQIQTLENDIEGLEAALQKKKALLADKNLEYFHFDLKDEIEELEDLLANKKFLLKTKDKLAWNFEDNNDKPYDYSADLDGSIITHGSDVSFIATDDQDLLLLPLKGHINDSQILSGDDPGVYEAVSMANLRGARVFSSSTGFRDFSDHIPLVGDFVSNSMEKDASQKFVKAVKDHPDMVFVVAAGNEGRNIDDKTYSICKENLVNLICVGAINQQGNKTPYSNYGQAIDVAVPLPDSRFNNRTNKGTSFTQPSVAKTIGKVLHLNPSLTPTQVRKIIQVSSNSSPSFNYGNLNEEMAISIAQYSLNDPDLENLDSESLNQASIDNALLSSIEPK